MSGIVLSASVRQNLLSLQSTADLLSTTQNRLSTGNKVNSALDNPTNFFTAQSLNSRASDINNLLDGIGNGVQVLQAANTGITSLQKLVDSAKSVANQALQTTVGYSTKSNITVGITGATSDNLLGTGPFTDATAAGSVANSNQLFTYAANTVDGAVVTANHRTAYVNTAAAAGTSINGSAVTGSVLNTAAGGNIATSDSFSVNGIAITFNSGAGNTGSASTGFSLDITTATLGDIVNRVDLITGNTTNASTITGNHIQLNTGLVNDIALTDTVSGTLAKLGLATPANNATRTGGVASTPSITSATKLAGAAIAGGADALVSGLTASDYLVVNNKTITFHSGGGNTGSIGTNDLSIDTSTGTVNDILTAIGTATGGTATISAGRFHLVTSTAADISFSGSSSGTLGKLGVSAFPSNTVARNTTGGPAAITGSTVLSGTASTSSNAIGTAFSAGDTLTVNGQNITFQASGASGNNQINVTDNVTTLLAKIDALSGATPSSSNVVGGAINLHTGTSSTLSVSSSNTAALAALGLSGGVNQARGVGTPPLTGLTLNIASTGGGVATALTFGAGAGQVKSLNDLNTALAANNLQATLDSAGTLTVTTSNDAASSTIGAITGSATNSGRLFNGKVGSTPVADAAAQSTRTNLVSQFNNILQQIATTSQDSSYNGVNLLSGDQLKLTFNETGKSTLSITGVNFNPAGLGLSALTSGTDFVDNAATNKVLASLNNASSALRSQSSTLGSNLSIVQIRQDFSKNLINVLQTGSSNLTLADTNEEAANSQALSTRQSIAVSALALANQSQQSVLQLLR